MAFAAESVNLPIPLIEPVTESGSQRFGMAALLSPRSEFPSQLRQNHIFSLHCSRAKGLVKCVTGGCRAGATASDTRK